MSTAVLTRPVPAAAAFQAGTGRRDLARLLEQFDDLAERCPQLIRRPLGPIEGADGPVELPRYVFVGPKGGGDTLRLGLFAAIHGDEPEGALGLLRLVQRLVREPELAQGYALYLYPVCNPWGYTNHSRVSRQGRDLNREFWKNSPAPEIRLLETELWMHGFHGLISLHSDDTSHGLYGFVTGSVLSEFLLEPALREAERHLPRNRSTVIDGFKAEKGLIDDCYQGVLRAPPGLQQPPFELVLETPQHAPLHRQVEAFHDALLTILAEFRYLSAIAQNI